MQIELEGVPLRTTLDLCLKQLGLTYAVRDGYLRMTYACQVSSDLEDPFLIDGHCLLALLAASLGAVAATVVAEARREPPGQRSGPAGETRPT